jgi:CO/xanthine dehydrogenase FAD-binding subunit
MDLYTVQTYLRPRQPQDITDWQEGWAWLAGGTWLFTEPQPRVTTLVDMQHMGWDELEVALDGLTIGATCTMSQLLDLEVPDTWTGFNALRSAVHELASFKVQNTATIAGNLCLALPASTFAPVMLLLNATYLIQPLRGDAYSIAAPDFQTGARQTILQPGDVLRSIHIPAELLEWQVSYRRICVATAGIAIAIVVAAHHPKTGQVRFGIGSCIPAPQLLSFDHLPSPAEMDTELTQSIPLDSFIDDETASAAYRRHVTGVLMGRSLAECLS